MHHAKDERWIFVMDTQLKISSCRSEGHGKSFRNREELQRAAEAGRLEVSRDVKDGRGC